MGVSSNDDGNARPFDIQTGRHQRITPTSAGVVVTPMRLIGGGFGSANDANAWTLATNGAASSAGVANNIATIGSGTASGGYGSITSATAARFLFASTNIFRGTYRVPTLNVANSLIKFGAFNYGTIPAIQDGYYFQYNGTTNTLSVNCINAGGAALSVSSGAFNGELSSYSLDTNAHNFEIIYQVATVYFLIDNVLIHTFKPSTTLLSGIAALADTNTVVNTAGSTGATLEVWASSIIRYGAEKSQPQYKNITALSTTTVKLGPGHLYAIVLNTAGSNTNTVTIFDSTTGSGTIIGKITNTLGNILTVTYDLDFTVGLTIVVATGTAGDITVVYE